MEYAERIENCTDLTVIQITSDYVPPGHSYSIEHDVCSLARIRFQNGPVPKAGVNGITNEDLLSILIHRTTVLNEQFPCEENTKAIQYMKEALDAFNQRTDNRKMRGVEGKMAE